MNNYHFIINARFLTQNITGVQRFAIEISKQLKNILGDKVQFVSAKNIIHTELAKELDVKVVGNLTGHLWEQIDLPYFLSKNGKPLLLNLANTAPIFYKNKVVTVYDLAFYHHPEWFSKKFALSYNLLIPKILKNSKHILTDSEFIKQEMMEVYKLSESKIDVVYGAHSDIFENKLSQREHFALAVGSIDPRKNLKNIIDIFANHTEYSLMIVGQQNKVFSSLSVDDLSEDIKFTGYVSDEELVELYNRASLFIYPSFYEGFGIPPLEAQSCGCPVIASNVASLPEVCGDSVVYCNPYSVEDIAEKIKMVLEDEALQNELRVKGFENIKRFSWEESAKKIVDVIERLR
ncbi:MAG: glycosyltransferase family 1 protein [Campylobacterales bacterium]|nr:glycosyltransferase family 1 protein [Campylobacterales bacterium]